MVKTKAKARHQRKVLKGKDVRKNREKGQRKVLELY
jgi:hypothetical protein